MLPWGSLRWNQDRSCLLKLSAASLVDCPDAATYCMRRAKRANRVLSGCPRWFPTTYASADGSVAAEEYPNGYPGGIGWFFCGKRITGGGEQLRGLVREV